MSVDQSTSINPQKGPELFIGLVGAVGTDLDQVGQELQVSLNSYSYECVNVRLSDFLTEFVPKHGRTTFDSEYDRVDSLMTAGDDMRKTTGRPDVLAVLACGAIKDSRDGVIAKLGFIPRRAYTLRSLKRPEEVLTLREIYGPAFYVVAAYCPREVRVKSLAQSIAQSAPGGASEDFRDRAEKLIRRDKAEEELQFGQDLRATFPLADVFVNATRTDKLRKEMDRFVRAVFADPFMTPSKDEYGMFHAKAAALRSADLSRQVGAAITSSGGQIIAVGTNEVPKYGGGLYWSDDDSDNRDFKRGSNPNRKVKEEMISEIVDRLKTEKWLSTELSDKTTEELTHKAFRLLAKTRIMGIGEFGRVVHAEMAALVDAARRGVAVSDGTMYSTTFPCHMCAKHIVAAGIRRVVYVEPYPKSMAEQQHDDAIIVDPPGEVMDKVVFEPFIGIAPRRYMDVFTAPTTRQTTDGKPVRGPSSNGVPRTAVPFKAYESTENEYLDDLRKELEGKISLR